MSIDTSKIDWSGYGGKSRANPLAAWNDPAYDPWAEWHNPYETDYVLDDKLFDKPLVIFKAKNMGRPAWWNGELGAVNVVKLVANFKRGMTVWTACLFAGISIRQYEYFCAIHPHFLPTKAHIKKTVKVWRQKLLAEGHPSQDLALWRPQFQLSGVVHQKPWTRPVMMPEFKDQVKVGGFMAKYQPRQKWNAQEELNLDRN